MGILSKGSSFCINKTKFFSSRFCDIFKNVAISFSRFREFLFLSADCHNCLLHDESFLFSWEFKTSHSTFFIGFGKGETKSSKLRLVPWQQLQQQLQHKPIDCQMLLEVPNDFSFQWGAVWEYCRHLVRIVKVKVGKNYLLNYCYVVEVGMILLFQTIT